MDPIERMLEEARERGDFDHLPGAGKPLDLRENPFIRPEWRTAYRLLAGSGFAPDAVEEHKALRARLESLAIRLAAFERRWLGWSRTGWTDTQRSERLAAREAFLGEYEEEMRAINGRIHAYNASAPRAMQMGTLLPAAKLEAARALLRIP